MRKEKSSFVWENFWQGCLSLGRFLFLATVFTFCAFIFLELAVARFPNKEQMAIGICALIVGCCLSAYKTGMRLGYYEPKDKLEPKGLQEVWESNVYPALKMIVALALSYCALDYAMFLYFDKCGAQRDIFLFTTTTAGCVVGCATLGIALRKQKNLNDQLSRAFNSIQDLIVALDRNTNARKDMSGLRSEPVRRVYIRSPRTSRPSLVRSRTRRHIRLKAQTSGLCG